jgi:hypothetical protein
MAWSMSLAVGSDGSDATSACSSDRSQARPRSAWRPTDSVAWFLYCRKPHTMAMPHARSTTPPNASSSFDRSDRVGAMPRTGTR